MPRKHRRDHAGAQLARSTRRSAPAWAGRSGFDVRGVQGDKPYRCPGCDHVIRGGVPHLVVVPTDDAEARRHWHTECWRRELRRLGLHPPSE